MTDPAPPSIDPDGAQADGCAYVRATSSPAVQTDRCYDTRCRRCWPERTGVDGTT